MRRFGYKTRLAVALFFGSFWYADVFHPAEGEPLMRRAISTLTIFGLLEIVMLFFALGIVVDALWEWYEVLSRRWKASKAAELERYEAMLARNPKGPLK